MAYKEVMDEYLYREKGYNDANVGREKNADFNTMNVDTKVGIGYSAAATALADFVYGFPNGFTVDSRDEYIKGIKEYINEQIEKSSSYESSSYYKAYLKMVDKLEDVNDSDFRKLVSFVTRHKRIEDKELARRDDGFNKAQAKAVNEIYDIFDRAFNNTRVQNIFFHVATTEEEKKEKLQKNKYIYILLRDAILNGFESTVSMSDDEFDLSIIENFSNVSDEEVEKYYRKPFNTVSSLTKKYKGKLNKKMSKKMIK